MACDPCPDCGEAITAEPTVEMIFINQDSIDALDVLINDNNTQLSNLSIEINDLNDTIDFLQNDSIPTLEERIAAGEEYLQEALDEVTIALNHFIVDLENLTDQENELDSLNSAYNSTKTIINSGLLNISSINLPEINESIVYDPNDSAVSWNFPLSFDNSFSIYEILISDELFSIELSHETFTEVDEERNVIVRARDIQIVSSSSNFITLDSCNENCVDGEAIFTFYF